jgi:hypothetical protein
LKDADVRPEEKREESMAQHGEFLSALRLQLREGWKVIDRAKHTIALINHIVGG